MGVALDGEGRVSHGPMDVESDGDPPRSDMQQAAAFGALLGATRPAAAEAAFVALAEAAATVGRQGWSDLPAAVPLR